MEIATKLAQANDLATQGKLQSEIARALGVSVMTLHRWRKAPPGPATIGATQAMTATVPQIEIARVKPVDRAPPNLRLSNSLIDLMKGFSLSSSQGIGGAWETPPNIATPDAFAERYGRW